MAEINISLTPKIKETEVGGMNLAPTENKSDIPLPAQAGELESMPMLSKYLKSGIIIALVAKIAKEAYDRNVSINRDLQRRTDELRQLGGVGYSAIDLGQRYDIFTGKLIGGVNVAYKRR